MTAENLTYRVSGRYSFGWTDPLITPLNSNEITEFAIWLIGSGWEGLEPEHHVAFKLIKDEQLCIIFKDGTLNITGHSLYKEWCNANHRQQSAATQDA